MAAPNVPPARLERAKGQADSRKGQVMDIAELISKVLLARVGGPCIVMGMFSTYEYQRMAQICCLCCAYLSSGTGRLVN